MMFAETVALVERMSPAVLTFESYSSITPDRMVDLAKVATHLRYLRLHSCSTPDMTLEHASAFRQVSLVAISFIFLALRPAELVAHQKVALQKYDIARQLALYIPTLRYIEIGFMGYTLFQEMSESSSTWYEVMERSIIPEDEDPTVVLRRLLPGEIDLVSCRLLNIKASERR